MELYAHCVCVCVCVCVCLHAQLLSRVLFLVTPWTVAHQDLCPWDYLRNNTGVGFYFFLQGTF